ncbi:hypothetical protein BKK51_10770 [Rodentibacter trehalosifermentans]|uniref:DUF2726 domain-containing protein n=3 Tax=Rodentibacter TaxID=1960084 RepID=A0A1V3IJH9_9PAST|nr:MULTISPECIES: DUF2726 domain-containing protein [Rodentibacter]OOF41480.1 hypothetical protein BKK50_08340 [Rodentibacter rarus]OOF43793.1 hypothetical protein BKK51_10770 [Rodentibacter trehalosifermentans]
MEMSTVNIILGIVFIFFLFLIKELAKSKSKNKYRKKRIPKFSNDYFNDKNLLETQNERIKSLLNTDLKSVSLMNKEEFLIFQSLEKLLNERFVKQKYRLFTQVGLGGFIKTKKSERICSEDERKAFFSINQLRADFLIIDRFGKPVLVIEYQGTGHRLNNSTDRDTRKRYACNKVGIELIEILGKEDQSYLNKVILFLDNHQNKLR